MGDRVVQLIFEKIKTPVIKEMNELEGTDRRCRWLWQYWNEGSVG